MKEQGVVASIDGNTVSVRFKRRAKCDRCLLCTPRPDGTEVEVKVKNTLGAQVGDKVEVEFASPASNLAFLAVHLIPIVFTAIGLTTALFLQKTAFIIVSVTLLILGIGVSVLLDRLALNNVKYFRPRLNLILQGDGEEDIQPAQTVADEYEAYGQAATADSVDALFDAPLTVDKQGEEQSDGDGTTADEGDGAYTGDDPQRDDAQGDSQSADVRDGEDIGDAPHKADV